MDSAVVDQATSGVAGLAPATGVASGAAEDGVDAAPAADAPSAEVSFGNISPSGPDNENEEELFLIRAENGVPFSMPLTSLLHIRHFFAVLTIRLRQDLQRMNDNSISSLPLICRTSLDAVKNWCC
jgi:hypothetical protein